MKASEFDLKNRYFKKISVFERLDNRRETESNRELPVAASLLKCLQQPDQARLKPEVRNLIPVSDVGNRNERKNLGYYPLPPKWIMRKLNLRCGGINIPVLNTDKPMQLLNHLHMPQHRLKEIHSSIALSFVSKEF